MAGAVGNELAACKLQGVPWVNMSHIERFRALLGCFINGGGVEGCTLSEIKNVFYQLSMGVLIDTKCAFSVLYTT